MVSLLLLLETCDFRPLLKLLVSILEAKEIKSYVPEASSKLWNRSHLLAAESREKLGTDNKPENAL